MSHQEIKIGGFGGQGVILAGHIIGHAATIYDGKEAAFTRSFGPEARGSACSAQVIVSDKEIYYPYVTHPDILVVMSQEAYDKFHVEVPPEGTLVIEDELVNATGTHSGQTVYGIPATRLAEELGRRIVLNIVMLGFFAAVTDLVSKESMEKAIRDAVPPGTEDLNLLAFRRGFEYGQEQLDKGNGSN